MKKPIILLLSICLGIYGIAQNTNSKITFRLSNTETKIDILADGKLFTSFQWPENICKPVLYPVFAPSGNEITRGFPVIPKAGERADHPHQIGVWLTYGNVNGNDFWGNGSQGLGTTNKNGGVIRLVKVNKTKAIENKGMLTFSANWLDSTGTALLAENTELRFTAQKNMRIIDRISTLTALRNEIKFNDTKEGMFAIRVARQLELPIKGGVEIYSQNGKVEKTEENDLTGITGNYRSSEGIEGELVWGKRAKWMLLDGKINTINETVMIFDHPKNPGYPTYWHARGYGLFSANPLGVRDFTNKKESMNLTLKPGKSITFRYRMVFISVDKPTDEMIEKLKSDFEK